MLGRFPGARGTAARLAGLEDRMPTGLSGEESQCELLQAGLVVPERPARDLCPLDGVLALLDPLFDMPITMLPLSQLLTGLDQRVSRR